jgi:hypothetical protein
MRNAREREEDVHIRWLHLKIAACVVTVRSKAWVCSRLITGIVGFNPAKYTCDRLFCLLCCVGGSGLCDELITRSEESYRVM